MYIYYGVVRGLSGGLRSFQPPSLTLIQKEKPTHLCSSYWIRFSKYNLHNYRLHLEKEISLVKQKQRLKTTEEVV